MRSIKLLQAASVCQDAAALQNSDIQTVSELEAQIHSDCPLIDRCNSGSLLGPQLRNCIPRIGQDVARFAAKSGGSVENEMVDFRQAPVFPKLGFIDPYDNPDPDATEINKDEICGRVSDWAKRILDGAVPSLDQQVSCAHCDQHEECNFDCRSYIAIRMAVVDRTDIVLDRGVSKRVSRDRCRCPILNFGDFCPVHGS